jgi:hypothetical protein
MRVEWVQCQGDVWCDFNKLNLSHPHFDELEGVYIIWHGGLNAATVYVGQGNIKERIYQHRSEREILAYQQFGLFVTWASVDRRYMDGVEKYLISRLSPIVNVLRGTESAAPIEVNLPW